MENVGMTNVFVLILFSQLYILGNVLISVILGNILCGWHRCVIVVVDCSYGPVFEFKVP